MRRVIFYSWQSDLPNPCNRGFIQTALQNSAALISDDSSVAVDPVVDRDTQDVPGSPDIAATIFAKIEAADIFVADVSIVTRVEGQRAVPNPNVLIELGYALKAIGHERVLLVFNEAFGSLQELPFDLRTRRIIVYNMPEVTDSRASMRREMEKKLVGAIKVALAHVPAPEVTATTVTLALNAIEQSQGNRALSLRRALAEILQQLVDLEPKKCRDGGTAIDLIQGIELTQEVVANYSSIVESIAVMHDEEASAEVIRWFGKVFEYYNLPDGFAGKYTNADQDFFKFIGHEMFVTLISFLMREQQWNIIGNLIEEPIQLRNLSRRGAGSVDWEYASQHSELLLNESRIRQKVGLRGDLLQERHTGSGGLASLLPFEDFVGADFFLFLLSQRPSAEGGASTRYWRAWSCVHLTETPAFIRSAARRRIAEQVASALKLSGIDELKLLLATKGHRVAELFKSSFWSYPIDNNDIDQIGTR